MTTVRKTAPGSVHYRALGRQLASGDEADVADGVADYLCDSGDFERVSSDADTEDGGDDEDGGDAPTDHPDDDLTALDGVGEATADGLRGGGYETFNDIADADAADVADDVEQLSEGDVDALQEQLAGSPAPTGE